MHLPVAYADDMNLLGDNTDTKMRNTETSIHAGKEVGLEANAEKTKYMLLPHHQKADSKQMYQVDSVYPTPRKLANRESVNVAKFKCFRMTTTNQNVTQKEIKGRLSFVNVLLPFSPETLSSHLPSKNVKMQDYNFACYSVWV
jgi:hypothetical protein